MTRILLVGLLVLGIGSATSAAKRTHVDGSRPTIVVTPSRGLRNEQLVRVQVTGFGNGVKVFLFECASAVDVDDGCGSQLAQQAFLVTSVRGAGTARFRVTVLATAGPVGKPTKKRCRNSCVVVASGINNGHHVASTSARIRFRA
jgi:Neocarzinostatin family